MTSKSSKKMDRDVKLSKSLSWLLRHGAVKENVKLDKSGYAKVEDILLLKQFKDVDVSDIMRVVENNSKQRFSLITDPKSQQLFIRANQGHSIPIDDENLLTPLSDNEVPPILYHGTYRKYVDLIEKEGLHHMKRNHIHLSDELPGATGSVSKIRENCDVCVVIDSIKAIRSGLQFFKSSNGVYLTPGDDKGFIPPSCFKGVWPMNDMKKQLL